MMKMNEALMICTAVTEFLTQYAPQLLTASKNTLRGYKITLRLYVYFLENVNGVSMQTLDHHYFERNWIEKWVIWLKGSRNCSPATCNDRLASLRCFIEFLSGKDITFKYLYIEAKQVKRQNAPKKKAQGMSRAAVSAILAAPDVSTPIGRRDLAFLTLLYGTAGRMNELLSLKLKDVHLNGKNPYVTFTGKGNKIRSIYILPRVTAILQKYISEFHSSDATPDSYLFYSREGNGNKKLTGDAMDKRIKKYAAIAHETCEEVPLDAHAHQFRHARATHWLEDGMNILEIQKLLGHEDLTTTMQYLDITDKQKELALATLDSEKDKKLDRKWKNGNSSSILTMCGLK